MIFLINKIKLFIKLINDLKKFIIVEFIQNFNLKKTLFL